MSTPVFVDTAYAADMLRTTRDAVLDLIRDRGLRTYGGSPGNPFVRSADIAALATELVDTAEESGPPKKLKSASARVQVRITADSRWADVSEDDIAEWTRRADPARRQAARTATSTAIQKLTALLRFLDEQ